MEISLSVIEDLAPDQASLNAAKKLLKPAKWPVLGQAPGVNSIWGQCQGSGANPYYTMADVVDHGYKCTCPSRKFPCKHVLALLWQFSDEPARFSDEEPPEWVGDWLGRRRKTASAGTPQDDKPALKKSIDATAEETTAPVLSAEEQQKKAQAAARRAEKLKQNTDAQVTAGLLELQQWIEDQLRTGLVGLIDHAHDRCRRIAARLVDAKAATLASRLDELPARIMTVEGEQQARVAFQELGKLALLCEVFTRNPDHPDARRGVVSYESRESVLADTSTLYKTGRWLTLGEKVFTRRDGLISHSTYLLQLDQDEPVFALLQDYYPAATGKRSAGFSVGQVVEGKLAFYSAANPLRAFWVEHKNNCPAVQASFKDWPGTTRDVYEAWAAYLNDLPWAESMPYLLPKGRIVQDSKQHYWWCSAADNALLIPLLNQDVPALMLAGDAERCFIQWNGYSAELLGAFSSRWGMMSCQIKG